MNIVEGRMNMQCKICSTMVKNWMRYCTTCGAKQTSYQWIDVGTHSKIERLNIEPSDLQGKKVRIQNKGSTIIFLKLDDHKSTNVNWLDFADLKQKLSNIIELKPNETFDFTVGFHIASLNNAFAKLDTNASLEINTKISFICTDIHHSFDSYEWSFLPIELPIFLAKKPFVSPDLNLLRFLSWERLEEGFEYPVCLGNFSPENRTIQKIQVVDVEDPYGMAITVQLPPEVISDLPVISLSTILEDVKEKYHEMIIPSHKKQDVVFKFQSQGIFQKTIGKFYGKIIFELDDGESLEVFFGGLLGSEPKLELQGYNPLHQNKYEPIKFVLHNSGDLPLQVTGVKVFNSNNENDQLEPIDNPLEDWLQFRDTDIQMILQPKETREIKAEIDISKAVISQIKQTSKNKEQEFGFRRVLFTHTNESRFPTVVSVQVRFGGTGTPENVYVGIDFGTSNSMVSVVNGDLNQSVYEMDLLQIADDSDNPTQLRSLLWYTSTHPEFFVGENAFHSAGQNWANLVRSMKTVVNQDATERFSFIHNSDKDGNRQSSIKYRTAQELMNFFINVLARSAERHLSGLVSTDKERLGLSGANISLSRAIFTHPVDIGPQGFQSLMAASHAAGLNTQYKTIEEFQQKCCVDESTAAALFFVYSLINQQELFGYEPNFDEKILCVDIGGGTSDITPIHYEMDPNFGLQTIKIMPSKGIERLGGDQLDLWLADLVLRKIEDQERMDNNMEIDLLVDDLDNLRIALNSYSYQSFTDAFQAKMARLRSTNKRYENIVPNMMTQINDHSKELLKACEKSKIVLSQTSNPYVDLQVSKFWDGPSKEEQQQVSQTEFHDIIQQFLTKLTPLIDSTLAEIFWSFDDISIILFTGQTTYSEQLRDLIIQYIVSKRKKGKQGFFVVHPSPDTFCPKSCVAKGGALYPVLTAPESPIEVIDKRKIKERPTALPANIYMVPSTLQGKLKPLPNLVKGAEFPVETSLNLPRARQEFSFYPTDATNPLFVIKLSKPVQHLQISLASLDADGISVVNLDPDCTYEVIV